MIQAIYLLCALTSAACALLLLRSHRASRSSLLFWSSLCFVGLALNNALLFVDLTLVPNIDLSLWRSAVALASIGLLLFGQVWNA